MDEFTKAYKAMTNPSDRELIHYLATLAGVYIWEASGKRFRASQTPWLRSPGKVWNPLKDHNQMALVKAGLRKQDISHSSTWEDLSYYVVCLDWVVGDESQEVCHKDVDELRAFALACWKMKEYTR